MAQRKTTKTIRSESLRVANSNNNKNNDKKGRQAIINLMCLFKVICVIEDALSVSCETLKSETFGFDAFIHFI